MPRSIDQKWDLLTGQDSYSGPNAQDPRTSRNIQSWIPQDDGQLHRELPEPAYASNTVSGPIVGMYEFDQNNGQGAVNRFYFCAARINSTVGTKNCYFYELVSGAWSQVTAVGTLADAPMAVVQENNFFVDDGVSSWLFNGTIWVQNGINFPLNQPSINVSSNSPQVLISNQAATFGTASLPNGGVGVYLFSATGDNGACTLTFPTNVSSAVDSVINYTNPSLLFNPPQFNGTYDPPISPMEWAELTSSSLTPVGYQALPYPANTSVSYEMAVLCGLIIPVEGTYGIQFNHDDGAYFGFGPGVNTGAIPTCSGSATNVPWQTGAGGGTAVAGYPILFGNNNSGSRSEVTTVTFPEADIYPLEMNYCNWNSGPEQCLLFGIYIASPIGSFTPSANPYIASSSASTGINATIGRYYWFDNADQTVGVATESSTSPIGSVTGPLIGGSVAVYQQPGLFTSSTSSTTVTGSNSTDNPGPVSPQLNGSMVGQTVYINGTEIGTVASVGAGQTLALTAVSAPKQVTLSNGSVIFEATYAYTYSNPLVPTPPGSNNLLAGTVWTITGFVNSSNNLTGAVVISSTKNTITFQNANSVAETNAASMTSPATSLTLTANALATVSTPGRAVICDSRCTHWNVYASESDGSKIGQYLFSVPVTQNLHSSPYVDGSPFLDNPSNTFLPIFRPLRNDRPFPSKILTVHKVRQWRRQESAPNFFGFTANEEVTAGNNGDPAQCLPGSNVNTVSDMVNVVSFPDQSARLRGLIPHLDALYMFSEKACYPLYGQSVDDFAISQNVAFALGLAGRFAAKSTTNGMVFISYDKKAYLYPTSMYATYLAQSGASASSLVEIGKPIRNILAQIPATRLDEVVSEWYHFGIRDWWVLSFPTSATGDAPQTWVYDFMGKGWFQLQRGFSSLAMLEVSEGCLVMIGGGVDGNTYVIDDQTGTYSPTGNLPVATWQPALIDFGNPEIPHVFRRLELEFDSALLAKTVQITVWLDPINVAAPGQGRTLHLKPTLGANRYGAFLTDQGGAVCQRMLLQIVAPANTNAGVIRGIKIYADDAPGFVTGSNRVGGV